MSLVALSAQLLLAVQRQAPTDDLLRQFRSVSTDALAHELTTDHARLAFWINLYNACYQLLVPRQSLASPQVFRQAAIRFSDQTLSLDQVEHGILRRWRHRFGLGYVPQLLPPHVVRKLAVSKIDYRIHFALNCGAKSCPPIRSYSADALHEQLALATTTFLASETQVDERKKVLCVTRLMLWFHGDFGGHAGIRAIHARHFGQDFTSYKIRFQPYDWSVLLRNFAP